MKKQISRFLRSEVMGRWQVEPARLAGIDVTRESLISLLQDSFEFSKSRATAEIDEFIGGLEEKLRRASGSETSAEETQSIRRSSAA